MSLELMPTSVCSKCFSLSRSILPVKNPILQFLPDSCLAQLVVAAIHVNVVGNAFCRSGRPIRTFPPVIGRCRLSANQYWPYNRIMTHTQGIGRPPICRARARKSQSLFSLLCRVTHRSQKEERLSGCCPAETRHTKLTERVTNSAYRYDGIGW